MAMLSPGLAGSHGPLWESPQPTGRETGWGLAGCSRRFGMGRLEFLGRDLFFSVGISVTGAPLRSPDLGSVSGPRVRSQLTGIRMWL